MYSVSGIKPKRNQLRIRLFATKNYQQQFKSGQLPSRMMPRAAVLRVDCSRVYPHLLFGGQRDMPGIIRDGAEAYTKDYAGRRVTGDREMRRAQGLQHAEELIASLTSKRRSGRLEVVGCGNTGQNVGCGFYNGISKRFLASSQEGTRRALPYSAVIYEYSGSASIQDITFSSDDTAGRCAAFVDGHDMSAEIALAITGQRLVSGGQVLDPYTNPSIARSYADFRHLVPCAYVQYRDPLTYAPFLDFKGSAVKVDFGLDQMVGSGDSPSEKFRDALGGRPVALSLEVRDRNGSVYLVLPSDLKAALADKSCHPCGSLTELKERAAASLDERSSQGLYYIDESANTAHIVFRRAPYPHHCVAVRREEPTVLYHVLVGGWSNNAGTNPLDLATDLRDAGFSDALLLDNGGDVLLWRRSLDCDEPLDLGGPGAVIPSSLGRECWAGLIAYLTLPSGQHATCETFLATCEPTVALQMHASLSLTEVNGY